MQNDTGPAVLIWFEVDLEQAEKETETETKAGVEINTLTWLHVSKCRCTIGRERQQSTFPCIHPQSSPLLAPIPL